MKSKDRPVLAPSSIPAQGGKYHELPGMPVCFNPALGHGTR